MAESVDINLPKDLAAKFPDRCVSCGCTKPGAWVRVCTHAIGWWTIAFWSFGKKFCVEVPTCWPCKNSIKRQKWISIIFNLGFCIAGVLVAGYVLKTYTGSFKRWLAMGIALVCILPLVLWEIIFPPAIELTAYSKTVDYEFRDPEYAMEFATLNDSE